MAVPVLVVLFLVVHRHYRLVARRLRAGMAAVRAAPQATNTVVVYVESVDPATALGVWYARRIAGSDFHAVQVPAGDGGQPPAGWWEVGGVPIETLDSSDGPTEAVVDYVWGLPHGDASFVTVVVPELFERRSPVDAWHTGPRSR